jgi:hypothetical protein
MNSEIDRPSADVESIGSDVLFKRVLNVVRSRWMERSEVIPPQPIQPLISLWPDPIGGRLRALRRVKATCDFLSEEGKVFAYRLGRELMSISPLTVRSRRVLQALQKAWGWSILPQSIRRMSPRRLSPKYWAFLPFGVLIVVLRKVFRRGR